MHMPAPWTAAGAAGLFSRISGGAGSAGRLPKMRKVFWINESHTFQRKHGNVWFLYMMRSKIQEKLLKFKTLTVH